MLDFRILGPLEVVGEEGPIHLGGPKQRATLAILLLSANRVVSVDRLADDLYAGDPPVTAVTQVQRQVSELRKALGSASAIETRPPGYAIRLSAGQFDLARFERGVEEGARALERGEGARAVDLLREALALWRGAAIADLAYEQFAQTSIARLEELRLAALEQRIEAELNLGSHATLIGELEQLVVEHPLREALRGQLMRALYRAGRQAEALDVFRRTRTTLVAEFGIEPSAALHELERAILRQDPSLDLQRSAPGRRTVPTSEEARAVLVLATDDDWVDALVALGAPLARLRESELIVARLVADENDLARAAAAVNARRAALGVRARTAAFTSEHPAGDLLHLVSAYEVDLVLLGAQPGFAGDRLPDALAAILAQSPADVAVLARPTVELSERAGVFVPVGGGEHDWAALELGAALASAFAAPLRLVGTKADPHRGQRDASRLLADASLAVQRVVGVVAEPLLTERSEEALLDAVAPATVTVVGISSRWRHEGIGSARRALVRESGAPVVVVHRGPRPGVLAPRESRSRFTWSAGS